MYRSIVLHKYKAWNPALLDLILQTSIYGLAVYQFFLDSKSSLCRTFVTPHFLYHLYFQSFRARHQESHLASVSSRRFVFARQFVMPCRVRMLLIVVSDYFQAANCSDLRIRVHWVFAYVPKESSFISISVSPWPSGSR
jgi:hypothetical protein